MPLLLYVCAYGKQIAMMLAALTAVAHAGVVVPAAPAHLHAAPATLIESGSSRVARTEDVSTCDHKV